MLLISCSHRHIPFSFQSCTFSCSIQTACQLLTLQNCNFISLTAAFCFLLPLLSLDRGSKKITNVYGRMRKKSCFITMNIFHNFFFFAHFFFHYPFVIFISRKLASNKTFNWHLTQLIVTVTDLVRRKQNAHYRGRICTHVDTANRNTYMRGRGEANEENQMKNKQQKTEHGLATYTSASI